MTKYSIHIPALVPQSPSKNLIITIPFLIMQGKTEYLQSFYILDTAALKLRGLSAGQQSTANAR